MTLLPRQLILQARGKLIPSGIMNRKLGFRDKPNNPHKKNLARTLSTNILLPFRHDQPRRILPDPSFKSLTLFISFVETQSHRDWLENRQVAIMPIQRTCDAPTPRQRHIYGLGEGME